MTTQTPDPTPDPMKRALFRYQLIAPYLTTELRRGQKKAFLDQLAARTWTDERGQPVQIAAETLRSWARRYRNGGLDALLDKARPHRGVQVLSAEVVDLAVRLKQDVPERSLERLIAIAEDTGLVEKGLLRRSTLHRALRQAGVQTRRVKPQTDPQDLDRYEAASPNDTWQSDMLAGPWLPDPERPGHVRRAWLYAYLDDHSRLLLDGRFSFKGDLPALEMVLRRALARRGCCRRLYYDNGATYRSHHMREIAARLGIMAVVFTQVRRPQGHGKIEALNRLMTSAFIAEVRASSITTLDELNEAFSAWSDQQYNRKVHGETGETPLERWSRGLSRIRFLEEEQLRQAFLFREQRTADKAGVLSLLGVEYQVGAPLARRRVELRFDPERLDEIEVWHEGRFVERVGRFSVHTHRRPRVQAEGEVKDASPRAAPTVDWLAHLVQQRRAEVGVPPAVCPPEQDKDQAVLSLLREHLDPSVVEAGSVLDWLHRHGPIDPERAAAALPELLASWPRDHHVHLYLDALLRAEKPGAPR